LIIPDFRGISVIAGGKFLFLKKIFFRIDSAKNMEENLLEKYKSIRQLSFGLAVYSSTSILGPLLIIGGAGYFLDRILKTQPWILIISVFIAFIVTNFFLFKKVILLNKWISQQKELKKENSEKEKENNNK
jgi:F0F1-type ATP synthase assembly protein I